jgi:hypothetical protein
MSMETEDIVEAITRQLVNTQQTKKDLIVCCSELWSVT